MRRLLGNVQTQQRFAQPRAFVYALISCHRNDKYAMPGGDFFLYLFCHIANTCRRLSQITTNKKYLKNTL